VVVWVVAVWVVLDEAMEVDGVGEDFVVEGFDGCLDLWLLVVLKGLATGARLMEPSALVAGLAEAGAGCFFFVVAVSKADVDRLAEVTKRSSAMEVRRSNIYCTPMGLSALSG
jgi:hypothetical protein